MFQSRFMTFLASKSWRCGLSGSGSGPGLDNAALPKRIIKTQAPLTLNCAGVSSIILILYM